MRGFLQRFGSQEWLNTCHTDWIAYRPLAIADNPNNGNAALIGDTVSACVRNDDNP